MCDRSKKTAALILIPAALLLTILPIGNVRVNEADAAELESLYGIGPAYSERIIEERKKNGPFYYPEDLEAVNGIGPQKLSEFRTMIDMTADEGRN